MGKRQTVLFKTQGSPVAVTHIVGHGGQPCWSTEPVPTCQSPHLCPHPECDFHVSSRGLMPPHGQLTEQSGSWGRAHRLRTHLVTAGDSVAQLVHKVLAVLAGQRIGQLLPHQLLRTLDDFAGRQRRVLAIVFVVDLVLVSPDHIVQQFLLHYGLLSQGGHDAGRTSSRDFA